MTQNDRLIGDIAAAIPMESWQLRLLADRGLCPQPRKLGRYRIFDVGDIPAIRAAAARAGYLRYTPIQAEAALVSA